MYRLWRMTTLLDHYASLFVCLSACLSDWLLSCTDYIPEISMEEKLWMINRERCSILMCYLSIWLAGLRNIMKVLDQVSRARSLLCYQILVPKLLRNDPKLSNELCFHSREMLLLAHANETCTTKINLNPCCSIPSHNIWVVFSEERGSFRWRWTV
jgi:hypothetical protein